VSFKLANVDCWMIAFGFGRAWASHAVTPPPSERPRYVMGALGPQFVGDVMNASASTAHCFTDFSVGLPPLFPYLHERRHIREDDLSLGHTVSAARPHPG
jgi:hypothetical protein